MPRSDQQLLIRLYQQASQLSQLLTEAQTRSLPLGQELTFTLQNLQKHIGKVVPTSPLTSKFRDELDNVKVAALINTAAANYAVEYRLETPEADRDVKDLQTVADMVLAGHTKTAWAYLQTLDTIVRESIPHLAWQYLLHGNNR